MRKKLIQQNIIKELGLEKLPEDLQIKLLTQMTESVLKRITIEVFEKLSEKEREEFEKLQSKGDVSQVDDFLKEKIPNYEEMVQEIIEDFKAEIKENIASLK